MSQQINLFNPIFLKQQKYFSARTMAIALGVIAQSIGLIAVFRATAGAVVFGAAVVAALGAVAAYRLRSLAGQDSRQDGLVDVAAGDDANRRAVAAEPFQAGRH